VVGIVGLLALVFFSSTAFTVSESAIILCQFIGGRPSI
jgi:hypothetical protein